MKNLIHNQLVARTSVQLPNQSSEADACLSVIGKNMGKKLSPDQMALYKAIDEILWEDWDPIGVNDTPEVRDEYHGYLPQVFRFAIEDQNAEQISSYLIATTEGPIGLRANKERCLKVAEKIVRAKNKLIA